LKQRVRDLVNLGWGRRKIAKELGCTEYKVRAIMRSLVIDKIRKEDTDTFEGKLRIGKVVSRKDRKKLAAVISDIHIPFHDRDALAVCLEYLKDIRPNQIILNGDIIDFYSVSRFQKDPMRIDTLQSEIDETRALLNLLRRNHPTAEMTFIRGNHEERLEKFLIDRASALTSLRCLSMDDLFGLSENKITFVDTGIKVGNIEVTHGEFARSLPGSSARGHFDRTHSSVLIGHIHRLNVTRFRNQWGTHTLAENGCLCDLQPEYARVMTNWQQGFSVIEYSTRTGDFLVHQHAITKGEMVVGDKTYRSESK
jgi:UDP-2,3-diacylglucosamine pyrophosphatase LpxH